FRASQGINQGEEWDRFAGLSLPPEEIQAFLDRVPFNQRGPRRLSAPRVPVPELPIPEPRGVDSTQAAFGRIIDDIAKIDGPLADRIVTTSPDVTVSTNLG